MEETALQMVHRLQCSRVKSCKAKAGKLISMEANPAIQNVICFTLEQHAWKDSRVTPRLRRGFLDADAKVAFQTVHTLCLPSEMVVVDEDNTCGYLIGVQPGVAQQLTPDHSLKKDSLVLPDLSNSHILLVQRPSLEVDFLGRIKKLDVPLSPLSDPEVEALFGEFDQSAECRQPSVQRLNLPTRGVTEILAEQEMTEDMVYG